MNHLVLFENFSDHKYVWPDAGFWLEKLHPEELCFLAVCNDVIMMGNSTIQKEKPLFEMIMDNSTYSLDPDSYDEDEGSASLEFNYEIPCGKQNCNIYIEAEAKGGFGPYTSASYMEPAEGGEPILNSIEISFMSYINSEDTFEALFTDNSYVFKSEIIDRNKLISAVEYAATLRVEADEDRTNTVKPAIPDKLMEKCESIRREIPDIVKGASTLSRFLNNNDGTK